LQLQIEQDLAVNFVKKGIQDDKDFQIWSENVHEELENAVLRDTRISPGGI
jgi:hypothetical protein